ncbi:MAG: gliding motility-associated C-terminal domain-containing protein, partial [Bacteroidetes bacterium]|nr:gliding motility-associated C-terminal domain-containing protein [Bacteroidota bacterium]
GKEFFVAPISNLSYTCKVLASENNTIINFNGGQSISLNAGQSFTWNKLKDPMSINSNKPVMVAQFLEGMSCAGKGDPALGLIPPFSQKLSKASIIASDITNITEHYLNIVMKSEFTPQLKINGVNSGAGFLPWPGNPDFSYKTISVGLGVHALEADSGFVATAYGFGNYNSYFYSAGVNGKLTNFDFIHDELICVGAPANFKGIGINANNWEWVFPGVTYEYGNTVLHTFPMPGNHDVTLNIATLNSSCPESLTKTVKVTEGPKIQLAKDTVICENSTVKLKAEGQAISFLWSTGDTLSFIETSAPGQYWLQSSNGLCKRNDTISVELLHPPSLSLGPDISLCEYSPQELKAVGKNYNSLAWSTGDVSSEITVSQEGMYWAEAYNLCGSNRDSIEVSVKPAPVFTTSNDTIILLGTSAALKATGSSNYSWSPNYGLSCVNCPNPVAMPEKTTTYYVSAKNEYGCSWKDTITVTVDPNLLIFVPNIFSPNGDGQNDVFYVRGKGVKQLRLMIYNRWGEKVFETEDIHQGWDGSFRGQMLSPSVFVYYLEAVLETNQKIIKKGDVTLIK